MWLESGLVWLESGWSDVVREWLVWPGVVREWLVWCG